MTSKIDENSNTTLRYLTVNDATSMVRNETLDNINYLVIPVIAAKVMVMKRKYYPIEAFEGLASTWNGVPVTVNHPEVNGMLVSANNPVMIERRTVGRVFNARFIENSKLKVEMWLDIEKMKRAGFEELLDKVQRGEMLEVSTGLQSGQIYEKGSYAGIEYDSIVTNINPDHIALVVGDVGACSIADGCGTMRVNCASECASPCACKKPLEPKVKHIDINKDDECDGVETSKVVRKTDQEIDVNSQKEGDTNMSETKEEVKVEETETKEEVKVEETETKEEVEVEETETKEEPVEEVKVEETVEMKVNSLVDSVEDIEVKTFLANAVTDAIKTRESLISQITGNTELDKEDVALLANSALAKLAKTSKPESKPAITANYAGSSTSLENKEAEYEIPSMFKEKK